MPEYLSLLRGINVSGQKMIKMPELVTLYQDAGCTNISTYIQSGNVMFDHEKEGNFILEIEQRISAKFHFQVPVLLRNKNEMKSILKANPYISEETLDISSLYVSFLSGIPLKENIEKNMNLDSGPDKLFYHHKEVYLYCPNGYGRTKLNNNFLENKLKLTATTRNWKTVLELSRLMDK